MSLHICQTCEHKEQRTCVGGCRCLLDSRPVLDHVMAQRCPTGRFGTAGALGTGFGASWVALSVPSVVPALDVELPAAPSEQQPSTGGFFAHLAHGAAGLTKAALGLDRTDEFRLAYRRQACAACPQATRKLGVIDTCTLCGCVISAKIVVASEKCPVGKW